MKNELKVTLLFEMEIEADVVAFLYIIRKENKILNCCLDLVTLHICIIIDTLFYCITLLLLRYIITMFVAKIHIHLH